MTKEERYKAINVLYELKNNLVSENLISRVDVVMKILCHEEDSCPYWDYELKTCRHANVGALATKPCEDAVSRQAVIDGIKRYFHDEYYQRTSIQDCRDCLIEDVIKDLPSVTSIRPKGIWETGYTYPDGEYWKCSVCKELIRVRIPMHFCPNCSADMRGENNEND